jgi:hypothetical protein
MTDNYKAYATHKAKRADRYRRFRRHKWTEREVRACIKTGRRFAVGAAVVAFFGIWASTASAYSTGQFTRAEATPDWTHGSFAGNVTWSDCNKGCKSYLVLVYDEPSVYTCSAKDWLEESDPNIRQVWNSGGQTVNKTISFEANNVTLIPGVYGQRLCMIGVQSTETEYGTYVGQQLVAGALFQVVTPSAPSPPATAPTTGETEACKLARKRGVSTGFRGSVL